MPFADASTPPLPSDPSSVATTADVLVIGAGVMGTWTAYWTRGASDGGDPGVRVTLLDAWGVGHPRATSGDETRISRAAHGADELYTRWSRASREHWLRLEETAGARLWVPSGVLWFARRRDAFEATSEATLTKLGIPNERLTPDDLRARWPQVSTDGGLEFALHEPEAGALMSRRGCHAVAAAFQQAGGTYAVAAVRPGRARGGRLLEVRDTAGHAWSAGTFVFACGPWLPRLFPEVAAPLIRVTKQDVVFVGPRAGDRRFHAEALPAWCDYDAAYYGIPAIDERGFKLAPDRYGPIFDPTRGERVVDPDAVRLARDYLRMRFPALTDAPTVETRVCQYETTPDTHFVIDRHPAYENVWLVGGGSGHGFKHGPRIGQYLAARLAGAPDGAQEGHAEARFRIGPREEAAGVRTGGDAMAANWEAL